MSIDRVVYEEVGRETTAPVCWVQAVFVQEWVFLVEILAGPKSS